MISPLGHCSRGETVTPPRRSFIRVDPSPAGKGEAEAYAFTEGRAPTRACQAAMWVLAALVGIYQMLVKLYVWALADPIRLGRSKIDHRYLPHRTADPDVRKS